MAEKADKMASVLTTPIYHEPCANDACQHVQAWHIEPEPERPNILNGKMTRCLRTGCRCRKWEASWGVRSGSR